MLLEDKANKRKPGLTIGIQYLAQNLPADVEVSAETDSDTAVNEFDYPLRFVQVRQLPSQRTNIVTDATMLKVACYAESEIEAGELCNEVADILENAPGKWVHFNWQGRKRRAWITRHNEIGGPGSNPDPDMKSRKRWTTTVQLHISTNKS